MTRPSERGKSTVFGRAQDEPVGGASSSPSEAYSQAPAELPRAVFSVWESRALFRRFDGMVKIQSGIARCLMHGAFQLPWRPHGKGRGRDVRALGTHLVAGGSVRCHRSRLRGSTRRRRAPHRSVWQDGAEPHCTSSDVAPGGSAALGMKIARLRLVPLASLSSELGRTSRSVVDHARASERVLILGRPGFSARCSRMATGSRIMSLACSRGASGRFQSFHVSRLRCLQP